MRYNEGKEIITRDSIHADMLKKIRAERRPHLVYMMIYAVEGMMVGGFASYVVGTALQNVLPLQVFIFILCLVPAIIYCATRVKRTQIKYMRAKRREYDVVEDTVYRVADNEYISDNDGWEWLFNQRRSRSRSYYADLIYFDNRGKIISTQNVLDYTFTGDAFYVVVFNVSGEDPILAYSKKIYEFRDK